MNDADLNPNRREGRNKAFAMLFVTGLVLGLVMLAIAVWIDRSGDVSQVLFGIGFLTLVFSPMLIPYALICFVISRVWQPKQLGTAALAAAGCVVGAVLIGVIFNMGLRIH